MSTFSYEVFPCSPTSLAEKSNLLLELERPDKAKTVIQSAQQRNILIIGAGPTGLRAAIDCALAGHKVNVFEFRSQFNRCRFIGMFPHDMEYLKQLGYPEELTYKVMYRDKTVLLLNDLQDVLFVIAKSLGVEFYWSRIDLEEDDQEGPVLKTASVFLPKFDTLVVCSGSMQNKILPYLTGQQERTLLSDMSYTEEEKMVSLLDLIRSSIKVMESTQGHPFKDLRVYREEMGRNDVNLVRMPIISFFSELPQTLDTSKINLNVTIGQLVTEKTRPLWGFVSNLPAYLFTSISFNSNDLYYSKIKQLPFDMIAVPFYHSRIPDKAVRLHYESSLAEFDEREVKPCEFAKPIPMLKSLIKNTSLAINHADEIWQQFEREECSSKDTSRNVVHFFLTRFEGYASSEIPVCGGRKRLNGRYVDYMIIGDAWLTPWFRFGVGVSDGWYGVQTLLKILSYNKHFSEQECVKVLKRFEIDMRHRALEYVAMIHCIRTQRIKRWKIRGVSNRNPTINPP